MSYQSCWTHLALWAGFSALHVGGLWVYHRLSAPTRGWVHHKLSALGLFLATLLLLVAPWLVHLWGIRGVEQLGGGYVLTPWHMKLGSSWLLAPVGGFLFLTGLRQGAHSGLSWSLEWVGCALFLSLNWLFLLQSSSLPALLLWLEIIGLCVILVLGFSGVHGVAVQADWRSTAQGGAAQPGVVLGLLSLLWANGLSTVLLLCGWGLVSGRLPNADFELLSLYASTHTAVLPGQGSGAPIFSGLSFMLGAGLAIKLMLQPMQFLLFSFYRLLPLSSFLAYLGVYYVVFLPVALLLIVGPLRVMLAPWLLLFTAGLVVTLGLLVFSLEAQADVRTVFAYSTVLNLSLMLLALVQHVH